MPPAKLNLDTLFCEAIAIDDAAARIAFIEQASSGDPPLREHLEKLVEAHFRAGAFLLQRSLRVESAVHRLEQELSAQAQSNHELGSFVGPYKIRELLGEGGMGSVYVADQEKPIRRRVALKFIKPGMDSLRVIARFEAERQALELMDHPNIAKVLDAGTTDKGHPYFVMELVKGRPVTEHCQIKQLTIRERLELFQQVCQAVQHAHLKGIIHRDLKPSNVVVTMCDATAVVKVIDFGIAKAIEQSPLEHSVYTGVNELMGTPLYMSPEQAGQSSLDIDTRSDVYSLGVLLYELLTGTTPFEYKTLKNAGVDEIRRMIREVEPPRPSMRVRTLQSHRESTLAERNIGEPRLLRRQLRGDLDWIVMKAMEKDRNRRYPTANALSVDIAHYLRHEPIDAGPPSRVYRTLKLVRRYRLQLAALACVLLAFLAATIVSLHEAADAELARQLADQRFENEQAARMEIQERETRLQLQLYAADVAAAWHAWQGGNVEHAAWLLERHRPGSDGSASDLREFAWHYVASHCGRLPLKFPGHQAPILAAAVSPDERLVASSDRAGNVHVWDLETARQIAEWDYSNKEVTSVAFSPDGHTLATAGQDSTVHLWRVDGWEEVARLSAHEHTVMCVAWSPDGRRLASSCRGGEVRVWNVDSGMEEVCLPTHGDVVRSVAWCPNGGLLAAADGPTLKVWRTDNWKLLSVNQSLTGGILQLAFSPDGQQIAFGGYQGRIIICDAMSGREEMSVDATAAVWSVTFTPESNYLLVGTGEGGPHVFRLHAEERRIEMVRTALERGGRQRATILTSSGNRLLTATEETAQLQLWDFAPQLGHEYSSFVGDCLAVLPRGRRAVTAVGTQAVELRGYGGAADGPSLVAHTARVILAAADPLERWLATYSEDGLLIVWNLASGKELRRITVPKDAYEMKFAPQGSSLALISNSAGVQFWDVLAGTWQTSPEIPLSTMQTVAFSSDGSLLAAAANEEPVIYVLDIRNLSQNPSPPPSSIGARGKELRFGTQRDGTQNRLRDGQGDGQQNGRLRRLRADQLFFRLCFSPDGKQLFAGGCTSDIQVWSIPSGQEQARLLGHRGPVRDLAISPDGKTLASMGADRSIRLWHVATGQELLTLAQDERPHWLTFANTTSIVVAVELDTPWHRGLAIFDSDGSLPTGPN